MVLIVINPRDLPTFNASYHSNTERFQHGFLTKSDTQLRLLSEQIFALNCYDPLYKLRLASLIPTVLTYQIESIYLEQDKKHTSIPIKDHYEKILMAKQIIEENLAENHSIPQLARQVGTNVQYLKKYFKQYFGKTVMNYMTEKKMEYAKELIRTGNYRIMDVARMTGYKHATHFTTAFKKHFGFIPNSLRYSFLLQQSSELLSEIELLFWT